MVILSQGNVICRAFPCIWTNGIYFIQWTCCASNRQGSINRKTFGDFVREMNKALSSICKQYKIYVCIVAEYLSLYFLFTGIFHLRRWIAMRKVCHFRGVYNNLKYILCCSAAHNILPIHKYWLLFIFVMNCLKEKSLNWNSDWKQGSSVLGQFKFLRNIKANCYVKGLQYNVGR